MPIVGGNDAGAGRSDEGLWRDARSAGRRLGGPDGAVRGCDRPVRRRARYRAVDTCNGAETALPAASSISSKASLVITDIAFSLNTPRAYDRGFRRERPAGGPAGAVQTKLQRRERQSTTTSARPALIWLFRRWVPLQTAEHFLLQPMSCERPPSEIQADHDDPDHGSKQQGTPIASGTAEPSS